MRALHRAFPPRKPLRAQIARVRVLRRVLEPDQIPNRPRKSSGMTGPELFFGLVGPAGTDLNAVVDALTASLKARSYHVYPVSLSELLRDQNAELNSVWNGFEEKRIRTAMDAGNILCETLKSKDAVIRLGLAKVRNIRRNSSGAENCDINKPLPQSAYIFKSLKRPAEADLLREICGDAFFVISVYEPRHKRIKNLAHKIAKSHNAAINQDHIIRAEELIRDDEEEEGSTYGQRVGDLFHKSDLFVEQDERVPANIDRFIKLIFGSPFITPTRDEYGSFLAHAIALRSGDLSRQVGAVILSPEGEVISEGCNEVPLQGGGAIWHDSTPELGYDNRDYKLGHDASAISKYEIFSEIMERFRDAGWLQDSVRNRSIEELITFAFHSYPDGPEPYRKGLLKNSKISRILEYGRVVHAEMHALCSAARLGRSVKGAILYTTTFPCHMCARHILAAGISRVVFIEPYPKSATRDLYGPMVQIDGDPCAMSDALSFAPFKGVAPKQYFMRFTMKRRKDEKGYALPENYLDELPHVQNTLADFETESFKVQELFEIIKASHTKEDESNEGKQ